MLEFYDFDDSVGNVTIYKNYLLLNNRIVRYCDDAYRMRLAVDIEGKKIYLFKLTKDMALEGNYNEKSLLKLSITKTYGRIASKDVIDFLVDKFDLNIPQEGYLKYKARYLADDKAILIDVKEGIK